MPNASIFVHLAALMWHGCQTDIARELFSVAEGAIEYFACKDGSKAVDNTVDVLQCRDVGRYWIVRISGENVIVFRVELTDQIEGPAPAAAVIGSLRRPDAVATCDRRQSRGLPGLDPSCAMRAVSGCLRSQAAQTDYGRSFPVKVLHTMDLGPERAQCFIGKVDWLVNYPKNLSGNAPVMLPRWPIAIYEKERGAEECCKPFIGMKAWDEQGRPRPHLMSLAARRGGQPADVGRSGNTLQGAT